MDNYTPRFDRFQADIERYLTATGMRERRPDGFVVFRGYDKALTLMFDQYLKNNALGPLVDHFRGWNWERSYNDFLLRLTQALLDQRDHPLLKRLWSGVIAKRRKLYNDVTKFERRSPGALPEATARDARDRLLESLDHAKGYAEVLGADEDAIAYARTIEKVRAGKLA